MTERSEETMALLAEYNRLTKERTATYHHLAQSAGLSDAAFWTLYVMCMHEGPVSQADVRRESMSAKQTVNSAIARLRADGLLELVGGVPGDARIKRLALTDAGRELCRRYVRPVLDLDLDALESLGDEASRYLSMMRAEHEVFLDGARQALASHTTEE